METFTRESLEQAIVNIDQNPNLLRGRQSSEYDLLSPNGKKYPPILVLSEANQILGGNELTLENFNNKVDKPFEVIRDLGFEIVKKETGFFEELQKFLNQVKTGDLKTKHYKKTFRNLQVKVSFGSGNIAEIPWIAFLGYGQAVQKGIYPVYLLYKKQNWLILAYGVSETNPPTIDWQIDKKETISFFFEEGELSRPKHYGASYCKLPQKQYGLKVDKKFTFKTVYNEKEPIQSDPNCQHTQGV